MIRTFETLVYSNEANRRLNRTSTDTAASDDPAMKWRGLTSRVNGELPLDELDRFKQHRQTPPTSFVRFVVSLAKVGGLGVDGLPKAVSGAWVDQKPIPPGDLTSLSLPAGKHTVVLAIDRDLANRSFPVLLGGDATESTEADTAR